MYKSECFECRLFGMHEVFWGIQKGKHDDAVLIVSNTHTPGKYTEM